MNSVLIQLADADGVIDVEGIRLQLSDVLRGVAAGLKGKAKGDMADLIYAIDKAGEIGGKNVEVRIRSRNVGSGGEES